MSGRRVARVYSWPWFGLEIAKVSAAIHSGMADVLSHWLSYLSRCLERFHPFVPWHNYVHTYAGSLSKTWIEHLRRVHTVGCIHMMLTQGAYTGAKDSKHSHSMYTVASTSWAQATGSLRRAPAAVCRARLLAAPPPGVYTRLHHRRWRHAEMSSFVLALIIVRTQSPRCLHSPSLLHIGSCVPVAFSLLLFSRFLSLLFSLTSSSPYPFSSVSCFFIFPGCCFFSSCLLPSIRFWYSFFLTFLFFRLSDSRLLAVPPFTAICFHT